MNIRNEKKIIIKNCNNIKNATINITQKELNIKYGPNGTGKSTISEAIFSKASNDSVRIEKLKPYVGNDAPKIEGLDYKKVRVFDENYIEKYLFKGNGFFDDSFKVFLKSDECDLLKEKISMMLSDLQGIFEDNSEIQKLKSFIPSFFSIVRLKNDNVQRTGGVGELLKGNGGGFEKYKELDSYKDYYNRDINKVSKWAKWRNEGINQMIKYSCPFCTHELDSKIEEENTVISSVFKNSALSTANAVLDFLQDAVENGYIKDDSVVALKQYIGNKNKSTELYTELQAIALETDYLQKKIEKICSFKPMVVTREQLDDIENNLESMRIDKRLISNYYNTDILLDMVDYIDEKVAELRSNTGELKGLFLQHELKIRKLIENRQEDINEFFAIAGFPYIFNLKEEGEDRTVTSISPIKSNNLQVEEPKEHLSWGERNAFALVMFMFEAISDEADLIVLDDPICAFDENKKFAIIRRLFDKKKPSFRDKTVLMLTHDMQPIIDFVHGNFFQKFGLTTKVNAFLIQNNEGIIKENAICAEDLKNVVKLTEAITRDEEIPLSTRIVNYRKYLEIMSDDVREDIVYDILSNLIHGRDEPVDKEGNMLDLNELGRGMGRIMEYLGYNSYNFLLKAVCDDELKNTIQFKKSYDKIIAIRLLLERHNLFARLKKEEPESCKFLNETNHIENDFIFQLDPRLFYSIPPYYEKRLSDFVEKNVL